MKHHESHDAPCSTLNTGRIRTLKTRLTDFGAAILAIAIATLVTLATLLLVVGFALGLGLTLLVMILLIAAAVLPHRVTRATPSSKD